MAANLVLGYYLLIFFCMYICYASISKFASKLRFIEYLIDHIQIERFSVTEILVF